MLTWRRPRARTATLLVAIASLLAASCSPQDDATDSTDVTGSTETTSYQSAPDAATPDGSVPAGPLIVAGDGIPASTANEPSGNFRMVCNFSHLAYDDPIVYPGEPGASHLHMFVGNTGADAFSTYESLRTTGDGTCQGGITNRSSYWAPAVLNAAGRVVIPDFVTVYYKGNGSVEDIQAVQTLPDGLRMIAGYDMAAPGAETHFDWNCELTATKQQTVPNCPTGERVGVVVRFPGCWDGVNLDSADHRSHMAYSADHDFTGVCPPSHPVSLPEFTIGFWFPNDGDSANWHLDSDVMPNMTHDSGTTFHSDWFGAWDTDVQETWTRECIHEMRDCKGGELGDGTQLTRDVAWPERLHPGPPTVDKPPR